MPSDDEYSEKDIYSHNSTANSKKSLINNVDLDTQERVGIIIKYIFYRIDTRNMG